MCTTAMHAHQHISLDEIIKKHVAYEIVFLLLDHNIIYVYIYIYIYIYIHTCVYIILYTHTNTHVYIYIYIYVCVY